MKPQFNVSVKEYMKIPSLPDSWTFEDFRSILRLTDYGVDIPDAEIQDMAIMALQDYEPEDAADLVMKFRLGDRLNSGQRQELIQEMQKEEIWEEYGDMSLHEEIFNISTVMYQAFPSIFPDTEAIQSVLEITPMNTEARHQVDILTESFICRLVADGMSEHSILFRLFDEQLLGHKFPEAENIIWKYQITSATKETIILTIISTDYWLKELKNAGEFQSAAYNDL